MNTIAIATASSLSHPFNFEMTQRDQRCKIFSVTDHSPLTPVNPQFGLFGHIRSGWKIIRPLMLMIEQDEDDYYIVSDDEFLVYGYGKTQLLAQQDYIISLIEYYQILQKQEDNLTQAVFNYLQSYLSPI
jgi:hypothetical protein